MQWSEQAPKFGKKIKKSHFKTELRPKPPGFFLRGYKQSFCFQRLRLHRFIKKNFSLANFDFFWPWNGPFCVKKGQKSVLSPGKNSGNPTRHIEFFFAWDVFKECQPVKWASKFFISARFQTSRTIQGPKLPFPEISLIMHDSNGVVPGHFFGIFYAHFTARSIKSKR